MSDAEAHAADAAPPPTDHDGPRIRKLDEVVVNRIAAGEVIQRPSSALKELLENSLDAGSTQIQVVVKDGGVKLMQITDDGGGIKLEDLGIVCERFTTSKLRKFEDLETIDTFGFRGEALASISHVAHVQITSKTADQQCAFRANYADGKLVPAMPGQAAEPQPCAGRTGTQILVEDLFFNVATRRKALRNYGDEYRRVASVMTRYAVHNAGVGFTLKKHGASTAGVNTQKNASQLDNIRVLFGAALARELLPVESSDDKLGFSMSGFVSNANHSQKRGVSIFFINNRLVDCTPLKRAVEAVYAAYLPKGGRPWMYMALKIKPQHVDVNVHPTKSEVRFLHEDAIIEAVSASVEDKLKGANASRTFYTQSVLSQPAAVQAFDTSAPPAAASARMSPASVASSSSAASSSPATTSHVSSARRSPPVNLSSFSNRLRDKVPEYRQVRTDDNLQHGSMERFLVRQSAAAAAAAANSAADFTAPPRAAESSPAPALSTSTSATTAPTTSTATTTSNHHNHDRDRDRDDEEGEALASPAKRARRAIKPVLLTSIRELRGEVADNCHVGLTQAMRKFVFVGSYDDTWALIQFQTKLYVINVTRISAQLFYQRALLLFSNFPTIRLSPPAPVFDLIVMALDSDASDWTEADGSKEETARFTTELLLSKRSMLADYFGITMSEDGMLHTLPELVKGHVPRMEHLPLFLLRLGADVVWTDEQECFETVSRQLAAFYKLQPLDQSGEHTAPAGGDGAADGGAPPPPPTPEATPDDAATPAHLRSVQWQTQHVVLPALRFDFSAPSEWSKDGTVIEVADLQKLYRLFERC